MLFASSAALLLAYALAGRPLQSQVPAGKGVLSGSVVDSLRIPVPDAEVLLPDIERLTSSDSAGRFRVTGLPNGTFRVIVRKLGFVPATLRMEHSGDGEIEVTVVLAKNVALLAADTVTEKPNAIHRMRTDFARRAELGTKMGLGRFVTRDELEKRENSTTINILRTKLRGFDFVPICGRGLALASRTAGASFAFAPGFDVGNCKVPSKCYAQVFLDGMRIYSVETNRNMLPPDLDRFAPNTLEGIEVYSSAAQTPAELNATGSACGTIVLWTRLR